MCSTPHLDLLPNHHNPTPKVSFPFPTSHFLTSLRSHRALSRKPRSVVINLTPSWCVCGVISLDIQATFWVWAPSCICTAAQTHGLFKHYDAVCSYPEGSFLKCPNKNVSQYILEVFLILIFSLFYCSEEQRK